MKSQLLSPPISPWILVSRACTAASACGRTTDASARAPPALPRLHSAIKTGFCFELRCVCSFGYLFSRFLLQLRHVRGFVIRGAVCDGHVLPLLFSAHFNRRDSFPFFITAACFSFKLPCDTSQHVRALPPQLQHYGSPLQHLPESAEAQGSEPESSKVTSSTA